MDIGKFSTHLIIFVRIFDCAFEVFISLTVVQYIEMAKRHNSIHFDQLILQYFTKIVTER